MSQICIWKFIVAKIMGQAQINVRTRACSRTSIARTRQAALTHNVRGKELSIMVACIISVGAVLIRLFMYLNVNGSIAKLLIPDHDLTHIFDVVRFFVLFLPKVSCSFHVYLRAHVASVIPNLWFFMLFWSSTFCTIYYFVSILWCRDKDEICVIIKLLC